MITKKHLQFGFLGAALTALAILPGCNKNNQLTTSDSEVAADNSLAENNFDEIFKASDEAASYGTMSLKTADEESFNGSCATVTVDTTTSPGHKLVVVDFGTGCTGNDGKVRSGKILIDQNGKKMVPGTVRIVTLDNFYVDGNKIEGTKTVTCNQPNAQGQPNWTVDVANGKITLANNGGTITWVSTRTRTMTDGYTTLKFNDDKYSITGSASGTNAKGVSYALAITNPLIIDFSCSICHLTAGTITITPSGKTARVVDYGNGNCDDDATITVGKKTQSFKIRKK